jgi:hypothetical protein
MIVTGTLSAIFLLGSYLGRMLLDVSNDISNNLVSTSIDHIQVSLPMTALEYIHCSFVYACAEKIEGLVHENWMDKERKSEKGVRKSKRQLL